MNAGIAGIVTTKAIVATTVTATAVTTAEDAAEADAEQNRQNCR